MGLTWHGRPRESIYHLVWLPKALCTEHRLLLGNPISIQQPKSCHIWLALARLPEAGGTLHPALSSTLAVVQTGRSKSRTLLLGRAPEGGEVMQESISAACLNAQLAKRYSQDLTRFPNYMETWQWRGGETYFGCLMGFSSPEGFN